MILPKQRFSVSCFRLEPRQFFFPLNLEFEILFGGKDVVEGCVRRVDGAVRPAEDREIVHSHEVLRVGVAAVSVLQEETAG